MPGFAESLMLSNRYKNLWYEHIRNYFKLFKAEIITLQDKDSNPRYYSDGWDLLLIFKGKRPPLRIEIKTRSEQVYNNFYRHDHKLAIEVLGNVELNKLGSSIYNSSAELWAYGFIKSKQLVEPRIWWRRPFIEWLKKNESELKTIYSNTNQLYSTKCVLVSARIIDRFLFQGHEKLQSDLWGNIIN